MGLTQPEDLWLRHENGNPHVCVPGRFGVGVKAYFVFLRYLAYLNLLHCVLIGGFILGPTAFYGRNNYTREFAVITDKMNTTSKQTTAKVFFLLLFSVIFTETLKFGGNDSVLDFFLGTVKGLLVCVCTVFFMCLFSYLNVFLYLQGYLDRSPVFFGFYTPGSLNLPCLNIPLLYLAGIFAILLLSLILEVRRSVLKQLQDSTA